jgi:glycine cleavage system H lipoate-binding protein
MTVILVLATFALFLLIDYFYSRRRGVVPAWESEAISPLPRLKPGVVAGFSLPDNLLYHPGHTWALAESPNLVRVGIDDFGARLLGSVNRINMPQRGQWIRQGQPVFSAYRDGQKVEVLSPIEGMVTDVNTSITQEPKAALNDPYGEGWLLKVQSPDARTNFRNLLGGVVARKWMEESAARLMNRLPALAGAVAQDGGVAVTDLATQIPEADWGDLAREFFLN